MSGRCVLSLCCIFLMLITSGCNKVTPIAADNTDTLSKKKPEKPSPPELAPLLPGQQVPVIPIIPNKNGLAALNSAVHNFGEVKQKTELQYDFVLTNNVNVPIRIMQMNSSCSCTWSESNDNFVGSVIEPNQKIDFPVFINTGTIQDAAIGKITIVYRYQTDDPGWEGEDTLVLEVRGTILPDYRIEPIDLSFGEIRALETQTAKRRFRVVPVQMESLVINNIKSSSDLYSVNIVSQNKEGYEVEVTFDGSSLANSERVPGHLVVETNSESVPNGLVTLSATYLAPITVEPADILVSSEKEGTVQETIHITSSVPSQIQKVNLGDSDLVHVKFDSALKTDEHSIVFSIDPCRDAEIDEKIAVEIMLFPPGRESIIKTVPVNVYRFYNKGE